MVISFKSIVSYFYEHIQNKENLDNATVIQHIYNAYD
jgi:hypothetical protein